MSYESLLVKALFRDGETEAQYAEFERLSNGRIGRRVSPYRPWIEFGPWATISLVVPSTIDPLAVTLRFQDAADPGETVPAWADSLDEFEAFITVPLTITTLDASVSLHPVILTKLGVRLRFLDAGEALIAPGNGADVTVFINLKG